MAFLLTLAVLTICVWIAFLGRSKVGKQPPGPEGLPVVGSIFQLDRERPWRTFAEWKREYGDIVYVRLANQQVFLLNSAKVAGDLLDRRASNYSHRPRSVVQDYLSGGLAMVFLNIGTLWRSMRRATHEALNVRACSRYHGVQIREGVQLATDMLMEAGGWSDHIRRFTNSNITSLLYAKPPLKSSQDPIIKFLDTVVDRISSASAPGRYLANHLEFLDYFPQWMSKWKRECSEDFRVYSARFMEYWMDVKNSVTQNNDHTPSFCATLVETQERHGLDDVGSAWLAGVLYLAGYDTTTATLGWLILALVSHPDVQKKAHEELDNVVGRSRIPTMDDMEQLPYIRAIMKEAMRWRPVAPIGVPHASLEDDVYEGYFIPKGSIIVPNILAMNHDPEIYGADADQFRPERFLNPDGTHKLSPPDTKDQGQYGFGFGRRICPGRHVAGDMIFAFVIVLWAMELEPGKDENGNMEVPIFDDVAIGSLRYDNPVRIKTSISL
uniref:Cytochrome p450 n=1 Tax=Moniliophthora roreri TaxID=221103 RepID=A0A0W0F308_MONRR